MSAMINFSFLAAFKKTQLVLIPIGMMIRKMISVDIQDIVVLMLSSDPLSISRADIIIITAINGKKFFVVRFHALP